MMLKKYINILFVLVGVLLNYVSAFSFSIFIVSIIAVSGTVIIIILFTIIVTLVASVVWMKKHSSTCKRNTIFPLKIQLVA